MVLVARTESDGYYAPHQQYHARWSQVRVLTAQKFINLELILPCFRAHFIEFKPSKSNLPVRLLIIIERPLGNGLVKIQKMRNKSSISNLFYRSKYMHFVIAGFLYRANTTGDKAW